MTGEQEQTSPAETEPAHNPSHRWRWLGWAVVVAVVIAGVNFVEEAAPKKITMIASPPGTTDHEYGSSYAAELEKRGLQAEIIEAKGSADNLSRVLEVDGPAMTFVMSGAERELSDSAEADEVFSIGSIALEPLWIFVRADSEIASIEDLDGARVLLGPTGEWAEPPCSTRDHHGGLPSHSRRDRSEFARP